MGFGSRRRQRRAVSQLLPSFKEILIVTLRFAKATKSIMRHLRIADACRSSAAMTELFIGHASAGELGIHEIKALFNSLKACVNSVGPCGA
jgi:hypothetical protein